ncbi:nuclease-related domain-containing protein [Cytobacillus firmus]|uniref:NERD domain-containing protein n=1 Tax=Cytobacillus firmus TaxID=1399 RepID=A0AA46P0B0_CYTFI|nr:nuclease-related domain-containing protein [Cytobacillus firmus]UYG94007.1 NERD domain-containing protein [Cytobacillus firmus]
MIVRSKTKPLQLHQLEALLNRIPDNHSKRRFIEEDYAKQKAGYKGERSLEYHLSYLPKKDYYIFHDLRLYAGKHYFQIDILILTPFFISVLEVKNISGSLYFNPIFTQMVRTIEDKEEGFPDPVKQVKRQAYQLKSWIEEQRFPVLPIEPLVVIANERSVIKFDPRDKINPQLVIPSSEIPYKINYFKNKYKTEAHSNGQLKKLINKLKTSHTPLLTEILQRYQISPTELKQGVQCQKCSSFPMIRIHGRWICSACKHLSKDAHIQSLKEYSLLINQSISNAQAKVYLGIKSRDSVKRLLQSVSGKKGGANRGTKYTLDFFIDNPSSLH